MGRLKPYRWSCLHSRARPQQLGSSVPSDPSRWQLLRWPRTEARALWRTERTEELDTKRPITETNNISSFCFRPQLSSGDCGFGKRLQEQLSKTICQALGLKTG